MCRRCGSTRPAGTRSRCPVSRRGCGVHGSSPRWRRWRGWALRERSCTSRRGQVRAVLQGTRPAPTFKQLTFGRGLIQNARFAPDGQTIVYAAEWGGRPMQLFETRPSGPESRPIGPPAAGLASISSTGEIALIQNCQLDWGSCVGMLARMPLGGRHAPRSAGRRRQRGLDARRASSSPSSRSPGASTSSSSRSANRSMKRRASSDGWPSRLAATGSRSSNIPSSPTRRARSRSSTWKDT